MGSSVRFQLNLQPHPAGVEGLCAFVLFVVEQDLFLTTKDTKGTKVDSAEIGQ
jgi:hypothetical protein